MSEYSITHAQRIDDYAVIQTLEVTEIGTGQVVEVSDVAGFNGTFVVQAVPTYLYLGVNPEGDWLFDPRSSCRISCCITQQVPTLPGMQSFHRAPLHSRRYAPGQVTRTFWTG
jgi:hypothetical protein